MHVSTHRKGYETSFEKMWYPFTPGFIVPSLVIKGPMVLGKKILKTQQFAILSAFEGLALSYDTWIPYLRMFCTQFHWNWSSRAVVLEMKMCKVYINQGDTKDKENKN